MPFIVYFFISLLTIYIPLPTIMLMFNRLAHEHNTTTVLLKILLLLLVTIDYKISFYWIHNYKVKQRYYLCLLVLNLFEFFIHFYLNLQYQTANLKMICSYQALLLFCMIFFPLSKTFKNYIFEEKNN
ncbi:hypothetical protein ACS8GA_002650 [Enterococcus hirae]